MNVITQADAKAQGLLYYFTGKPCKRGHLSKRSVVGQRCVECDRLWNRTNRDKVSESNRAYYEANRDQWTEAVATREARKLCATPAWADKQAIRAVYAEADRLTRETGIPHHVDHIVPLQSPIVSGLHVHWNLRPLPATENLSKGNKLLEECHA